MWRRAIAWTALLWGLSTGVQAKSLHWSSMAVEAALDAEGRLHVIERQAMVFDGDWNGGERRFRVAPGQKLELHGMSRIDGESGAVVKLVKGDLDEVDHYGWMGSKVLRWRSRLPSDPFFSSKEIVYQLDYTLSRILQSQGEGVYRLDHDFAFGDRYGNIERFELLLRLDPAWSHEGEQPYRLALSSIPPGRGAVVQLDLSFRGEGTPAMAPRPIPFPVRAALVLGALAAVFSLFRRFRAFEAGQGRYSQPAIPEPMDRAWLEEEMLSLRAEEAGALWDNSIGAPEVSALIARLVAEGKLASSVREEEKKRRRKKGVLELELLAERGEFRDYERKLIDKLFFGGRTTTDTETVKKHYKSSGFSPGNTIRPGLTKRLERLPGLGGKMPSPSWKPTLYLFLAFVACLLLEVLTRGIHAFSILALVSVVSVFPSLIAYIFVFLYRSRVEKLWAFSLGFLIPLGLIAFPLMLQVLIGKLAAFGIAGAAAGIFGLLAPTFFLLSVANSYFNNARTRDGREAVAERRKLAAIRRWFKGELQRKDPDLEDGWLPYLLAFGLAKDVDRWTASHGSYDRIYSTSSLPGSGASPSWTGGGGTFGGAGATAAWTAAATGLAAGVARPGSSSSGGGGGGGGGSSGGGGGGGW